MTATWMASVFSRRLTRAVLVAGALAAWTIWETLPPQTVAFDDSCMPYGFWARISEQVFGLHFWTAQLNAAERDRITEERRPELLDRIQVEVDAVVAKAQSDIEDLYRKYPSLAPSSGTQRTTDLRRQAEEVEFAEIRVILERYRLQRIDWLNRCGQEIRARL